MKISHRHLLSATALAAGLMIGLPNSLAPVHAQDRSPQAAKNSTTDGATSPTNPGFNPDTGKINDGGQAQTPSSSNDIRKIPTQAEARAALMAPDDPNPVPGQELKPATQSGDAAKNATTASGHSDPTMATGGQAAVGGPMSPGASAGGQNSSTPGGSSSETTGARATADKKDMRPGPIGATGQTMPSEFSQRNDVLDRVPLMALPFALTDEQRARIFKTVMDDKSRQPAAGADTLTAASELSTEQALNEAQPLPKSLQDIEPIQGLFYVKAKNKVLLVTPATRTVRDEITM